MVDIHTHILNCNDDSNNNYLNSVKLINEAINNGVTDLVLTPHYINGSAYQVNNIDKYHYYKILKKTFSEKINLYLGNEVFLDNNLEELLENDQIMTINNSRYLLVELPVNNEIIHLEEIILKLKQKGIILIIAHPERYQIFRKNIILMKKYLDMGCLFQANIGSILGLYGHDCMNQVKKMFKSHYIQLLGTDTHHTTRFYERIEEAKNKIVNNTSLEYYNEIAIYNPKLILNNESVIPKVIARKGKIVLHS